jgi:hypothetical protein
MGERDLALQKREVRGADPMQVDTFGSRFPVEWDTDSSATTGSMRVGGAVAPEIDGILIGVIDLLAGSPHRRPILRDPCRPSETKSAGITPPDGAGNCVFR